MDVDASGFVKIFSLIRWGGLVTAGFIVLGAYLALRFLDSTVQKLAVRFTERRLLLSKVETFLRFFVYLLTAAAVVAVTFRLDDNLITVLGGTLIFTVGFALKDLAASVVAGITLLVDKPFQVGDRVKVAGSYGEIKSIGLRSVRLMTLDDDLVTIPNNRFLTEIASSNNDGALEMMIVCDFFVGADQDVELARRLVHEAVLSSQYVTFDRPAVVHVAQLIHQNHFAVRLRSRAYVCDILYEEEYSTDVTLRVLRAFREHGVEPPAVLVRDEGEPSRRRGAARGVALASKPDEGLPS